jgi:hypothetical protein
MFLYCSDYRKKLKVWLKKHDPNTEEFIYPWPNEKEWSLAELYALEQYYLGESFICKPAVAYSKFFEGDSVSIADIKKSKDKTNLSSVKVIVKDFFEFRVKKEGKYYGQTMIKATIEDKFGDQCSCTIFPDRWKNVQQRIQEINKKATFGIGIALHFSGSTNNYEDNMGVILDQLFNEAQKESDYKKRKELQFSKQAICTIYKLTQDKADLLIENLFRLNLCQSPAGSGIAVGEYKFALRTNEIFEFTSLGYDFVKLCRFP